MIRPSGGIRFTVMVLTFCLIGAATRNVQAQMAERPQLIVLTETGAERDGLPVYTTHPSADSVVAGLSRGLSGLMLRIYTMEQNYLEAKEAIMPEPAYVLLSSRQGGYARKGFVLDDEPKPDAGYVDVHMDWPVSGTFGAIDQIVPHELAHVVRRQLAGELRDGGTNQVHALGLRTDRVVAFNEGFAEHFQTVAFERSPDVSVMTELAADKELYSRVHQHLDAYKRELTARLAFAPRMRLGFVAWYSNDEDVLRYHGVRDNSFAIEPSLPERLLTQDPYKAYLLEGVLPGEAGGRPKSLGRMGASEGVVAAFFYKWAMDPRIGARRLDEAFYAPFDIAPGDVTDLENTYLKIFEALYVSKPQTVFEIIEGYVERFPEERGWIDSIATTVFHGPVEDPPRELWMANRDFQTGTTLFDQFRGLPRTHTFDLNAASLVDLVSVPGVTPGLARQILAGIPYKEVADIGRVDGISESLVERFEAMHREMDLLRQELTSEGEETLSIMAILRPVMVRGIIVFVLSSILGWMLYGRLRRRSGLEPIRHWFRRVLNALLIGITSCAGGWGLGLSGIGAVATVGIICGVPAFAYQLFKGNPRAGLIVWGAWMLAALPAALLTGAWF